jgi:hypothetical protein
MSDQPPAGPPEGAGGTPEPPFGRPPEAPHYGDPAKPPSYGAQPPSYGQPPGNYGAGVPGQPMGLAPQNSPLAIVSLVTGILGIPCCGCLIFGIVAAITGFIAKKQIAESGGTQRGASLAQWGFILGIVGIVLGVLVTILQLTNVIDSSFTFNQSGFDT